MTFTQYVIYKENNSTNFNFIFFFSVQFPEFSVTQILTNFPHIRKQSSGKPEKFEIQKIYTEITAYEI